MDPDFVFASSGVEPRRAALPCMPRCVKPSRRGSGAQRSGTKLGGAKLGQSWGGQLPRARCIKALRGEDDEPMEGTVWEPSEQTGRVMLVSENAFIEACAYAIANPVAAGLVHNVSQWNSFVSSASDMIHKRTITIKRPECLSDTRGRLDRFCRLRRYR